MKHRGVPTKRRTAETTRAFVGITMIALLLSWSYRVKAEASPGDLDPNFGTGGKVITEFTGPGMSVEAFGFAVQPDGKIVVVGGGGAFVLARYNPDGGLDFSFGTGGEVITDVSRGQHFWSEAYEVGILPDGRIVAMGCRWMSREMYALVCYNPDGSLDTSFGDAGMLFERFLETWPGSAHMAIQMDGRILLAGGLEGGFGFVRFNPDGTLDASFGTGGKVAIKVPELSASASSVTLQTDGRIVAAGWSEERNRESSSQFTVIRLGSEGSLDPTFGTGGVVRTDIFGDRYEIAGSVVIARDGRIVVAGGSFSQNGSDLALVRYNPDGTCDNSFGDGGKITTDFEDRDSPADLVLQPDGRIVVAKGPGFDLVRYNPDGSLDLTFGSNGVVSTDFSDSNSEVQAGVIGLALAGDDRIVAVGSRYNPGRAGFVLACYVTTGVAAESDFELWLSQPDAIVLRGQRVTVKVRIARFGGFTGDVTVTPPDSSAEGIICKYPEPETISGTKTSFKFKVKGFAAPGPHQLTFVGRDATGRERTATMTLFVN